MSSLAANRLPTAAFRRDSSLSGRKRLKRASQASNTERTAGAATAASDAPDRTLTRVPIERNAECASPASRTGQDPLERMTGGWPPPPERLEPPPRNVPPACCGATTLAGAWTCVPMAVDPTGCAPTRPPQRRDEPGGDHRDQALEPMEAHARVGSSRD